MLDLSEFIEHTAAPEMIANSGSGERKEIVGATSRF